MFAQLGDLLLTFPAILRSSHFIFVPGPADPFVTPLLPRVPLPTLISQRLKARVGSAAAQRMHFTSNPARLQYFGQEIVVCRDDLMGRMLRNTVRLKEEARDVDLKKYVSLKCEERKRRRQMLTGVGNNAARLDDSGPGEPLPVATAGSTRAVGARPRAASLPHANSSE